MLPEKMQSVKMLTDRLLEFPRVRVGHLPTPVEPLSRLSAATCCDIWVKRDDCTGIGFGGNKVRQLDFYLGQAVQQGATQVLITGAVQSNFVRVAAAMAARQGMGCHIQLEERVLDADDTYRQNGNVFLSRMLGATLYSYPEGEDEVGADARLFRLAQDLRSAGEVPFIVPLAPSSPPTGALGYVDAALELIQQNHFYDDIFVASGSSLTHSGLLFGLRALGNSTTVYGVCVRRDRVTQKERVRSRLRDLALLLDMPNNVLDADIRLDDCALAPGYGRMSTETEAAILKIARLEGMFLDPVYTGKVMAALMARTNKLRGRKILFWHTGGQPALFGYTNSFNDL
ncbi:D-cysteine desulfhydrase family protein [Pseudopelagicola sp. nBUS_20]|uniref:D-cysteine desulfhydrase family protein n=1 Tax=Pseudopelagicola sp. nBUS_20 TaxID=3395317 RepID=UPI003EB7A52E